MRNKIQKYLSGDHEGFSLVELIIVIAIMAILIGVVALAVLPYLEKSRESKDLSTMDTVCSALVSGVANSQTGGSGSFTLTDTPTDADVLKVQSETKAVLGNGNTDLKSSGLNGYFIVCHYDASSNQAYVFASNNGTAVGQLKRTETGYTDTTLSAASTKPTKGTGKAAIVSN